MLEGPFQVSSWLVGDLFPVSLHIIFPPVCSCPDSTCVRMPVKSDEGHPTDLLNVKVLVTDEITFLSTRVRTSTSGSWRDTVEAVTQALAVRD